MSSFTSFLERHLGSHYRTEIILGAAIVILVFVLALGYMVLQMSAPVSTEQAQEWSAEDKKKALEDLHVEAREQGVPRLSDSEKVRLMQSVQNGQIQ